MNERIQELAKQAGFHIELNWDHTDWHSAGHSPLFEKFAELIVAECAHVAVFKDSGMVSSAHVAGYMAAGRSIAAKLIKEHFGVEA
jgi:hypothetical protein